MSTIEVAQDPEVERFVITLDERPAGFTQYLERHGRRVFVHTKIDDAFARHGLATALIRAALEATREQGLRIVAVCPFVAAYVSVHHDFDDILDPPTAIGADRARP